jgi:hypothetical protein
MSDLQIETNKAQRIIALVLREQKSMHAQEANELAALICRRLDAATLRIARAPSA